MGRQKQKHVVKEANHKKTRLIEIEIDKPFTFTESVKTADANELHSWVTHFYRGTVLDEDFLVFDIYHHSHIKSYNFEFVIDVRISDKPVHVIGAHFQHRKTCMSCPPFLRWADFINPENNYIVDGKAKFQIYIADRPKKYPKIPNAVHYPGDRTVELSVGKMKFYVNDKLLAFTSKYFERELERGTLNEEDPFVIDDVNVPDFQLFLDLVYNPKQYFTGYQAKDILELAQRFESVEIMQSCQNVLLEDLNENKLSTKEKIKLTEQYDLEVVKELFNPDKMPRPKCRPRFMKPEVPLTDDELLRVHQVCDLHRAGRERRPSCSEPLPLPPIPISPPSSPSISPPPSINSLSPFALPRMEDEVIVLGDTDDEEEEVTEEEKEEEEEEDFDCSMPSTSSYYG
ncbi:unnamed protein product [Caenorhabditis brenneri]